MSSGYQTRGADAPTDHGTWHDGSIREPLQNGTSPSTKTEGRVSPVSSHTEWDPLEEIVVGRVQGTACPPWHVTLKGAAPRDSWELLEGFSGTPAEVISPELVEDGQSDLDGFLHVLEAEGIRVRRPDPVAQTAPYATPQWSSEAGYNVANPRDIFLVIGDHIIEAAPSWRSRYFEQHAYRSLLKEYFQAGARWTAAPKPELPDALFDETYEPPPPGAPARYVTNEFEPVFDAADFTRLGRDLVCIRSNTTNAFGIEWVRRLLGDEYTVHVLDVKTRQPMHIDTTIIPLAPGKVMINPEWVDAKNLPPVFKHWEVREAPQPVATPGRIYDMSSLWLSINTLMLDEERVIVEKAQEPLIRMLRDWGFKPIPVQFHNYFTFGGSFHCSTLDVRRRGTLQSYA